MTLAARLLSRWIPSPVARLALRETQEQLLWSLHRTFPPPEEGDDPVEAMMDDLGETLGRDLIDRLGLTRDRHGAVHAWRITSRLGGLRLQVREEPDRSVFEHQHCPLWDRFRQEGEIACPRFCESVARGLARAIAPGCRMEVLSPATLESPCVKALIDGG